MENLNSWDRYILDLHCVKSVRIRRFFGPYFPEFELNTESLLCKYPYSVRMRENVGQKNFEYGHFSHSAVNSKIAFY